MDRRYFLHLSAVTAGYLLVGCEDCGTTDKKQLQKQPELDLVLDKISPKDENIAKDIIPFTKKLKIPSEINFSKVSNPVFIAQKSEVNIFDYSKTSVLTFQGDLPNPTIRINKGDSFTLAWAYST
jgi:FtsP/CotA-like multicopper oxidase with cupredoxin domain